MAVKIKLMPCPFCGQDMNVKFASVKLQDMENEWFVACRKCGGSGPRGPRRGVNVRWNKRNDGKKKIVQGKKNEIIN